MTGTDADIFNNKKTSRYFILYTTRKKVKSQTFNVDNPNVIFYDEKFLSLFVFLDCSGGGGKRIPL